MTWAEFKLRLISFNRSEQRKSVELRQLCYFSGLDLDPKKVKKPSDLWKIEGIDDVAHKQNKPTERQLRAFKREMDNYLKIKNNG